IDGVSIRGGTRELRRHIGFVPQELALYGELTARENLVFFGKLYGLDSATLKRRVDEVLASIGLSERASTRAREFSGGMKRRLNLGMALVHEPRLLLLDEPTTGVDPHSRLNIFEEVRRLHAAGITIVYTSHYMKEVEELCQRVAILNNGRLIACDEVSRLLGQADGVLRFRVPDVTPELRARLSGLPEARLLERDGPLELVCNDVKATLLRLLAVLKDLKVELLSLETEEPDLERVFMEMTGAELRD
ncbi:MAG: ABC transporter ATP-binding protein, partial [Gemmataceae bacterium]